MTELQAILKDTLARWEQETQTHLTTHDQEIRSLQQAMHQWQTQQTLWEQRLQSLTTLCMSLETLLQRLSKAVNGG